MTDLKLDLIEKIKGLKHKLWGYWGYEGADDVQSQIDAFEVEFKKATESSNEQYATAQAEALKGFTEEADAAD